MFKTLNFCIYLIYLTISFLVDYFSLLLGNLLLSKLNSLIHKLKLLKLGTWAISLIISGATQSFLGKPTYFSFEVLLTIFM
jgi:hypothetical protein